MGLRLANSLTARRPALGSPAGPSNPPDQSHFYGWWKGDAGITLDSGNVSLWENQAGDVDLIGYSNKPLFVPNGINNIGTIRFNGSSQFLWQGESVITPEWDAPLTIYMLVKALSWQNGDRLFSGYGTATNSVYQDDATPKITGNSDPGEIVISPPINEWFILTNGTINETGSFIQLNKNTPNVSLDAIHDMNALCVGAQWIVTRFTTNWANIEVAEILFYGGEHNESTRTLAQEYLAARGQINI